MADENIKYGFFDSVIDEDTGDYDRLYSAESFNSFFAGLVTEFGYIKGFGDSFNITFPDSNEDKLIATIRSGKAIIKNHWFEVNNAFNVTLDDPPLLNYRWDAICIILNINKREIELGVHQGNAFTAISLADATLSTNYLPSINGYIGNGQWRDDGSGILEMPIWYILRYSGENKSNPTKLDNRDSLSCPRISGIAPNAFDTEPTPGPYTVPATFDQYLATYKNAFSNWFTDVKNDLRINTNVAYKRWKFNGSLTNRFVLADEGFKVESNCMINVYMNGIKMIEPEYTTNIVEGTAIVTLTNIASFTTTNQLVIEILQGGIDQSSSGWDYEVENPDVSEVFSIDFEPFTAENINSNWILDLKFTANPTPVAGRTYTLVDTALNASGNNNKVFRIVTRQDSLYDVEWGYVSGGTVYSISVLHALNLAGQDVQFIKDGKSVLIKINGMIDAAIPSAFNLSEKVSGKLTVGGRDFNQNMTAGFNGTVDYIKFKVVR